MNGFDYQQVASFLFSVFFAYGRHVSYYSSPLDFSPFAGKNNSNVGIALCIDKQIGEREGVYLEE